MSEMGEHIVNIISNTEEEVIKWMCAGQWECPECGYIEISKIINANSGMVGTDRSDKRRVCPNEGKDMEPLWVKNLAKYRNRKP